MTEKLIVVTLCLIFLFPLKIFASSPQTSFYLKDFQTITESGLQYFSLEKYRPLKKLTATNYHPFYIKEKGQIYEGLDVHDLLSSLYDEKQRQDLWNKNVPVILVDRSGSYSTELKYREFAHNNKKEAFAHNILAMKKSNKYISPQKNGFQIIYSTDTIQTYPHLKKRQFWCWWIQSVILAPYAHRIRYENIQFNSPIILSTHPYYPRPYGISSRRGPINKKSKTLKEIKTNGIKHLQIQILGGQTKTIPINPNFHYFVNINQGVQEDTWEGTSLYVVSLDNKDTNTISTFHYSQHYIEFIKGIDDVTSQVSSISKGK